MRAVPDHERARRSSRLPRALVLVSLLAAAACVCARAQAQPGADSAPPAPGEAEVAAARDEARALYERASAEYESGHYARAIELLRQAHAAYPSTLFVFNIAQAQRQLGDCSGARQSYLDFLDTETDPELRARATVGLERLQDCRPRTAPHAEAPQAPAGSPSPGRDPRVHGRPLRLWLGWTSAGALATATAITGGLALSSLSRLGDLEAKKPADPSEVAQEERRAHRLAIASDVLAGATLIAAGLSLYWTIKGRRARRAADRAEGLARLSVHLSSAELGCSLRF